MATDRRKERRAGAGRRAPRIIGPKEWIPLIGRHVGIVTVSMGTPLLPPEALLPRVSALSRWQLSADQTTISTHFLARDWSEAMKFINALSDIAEDEGHHPDISLTNYREVSVDLTTHDVGGLTMPDLVVAAKLDAIPVEYSAKWLRGDDATAYRPAHGS